MSLAKSKIVLKKLKELDTIWHPESGLVFKSATDKVVISRWVNEENFPLDDEAIELCEKWKFKYDTSVFGDQEEEEEGEDEDAEEQQPDEAGGEEDEPQQQEEEVEQPLPIAVPPKVARVDILHPVDDSEFKNITSNLNKYVENLNSNISNLKTDLLNKTNEYTDMTNRYNDMTGQFNNMKDQYTDMKDQYDKLKAKFDGIKSLFS